MLTVAGTSPATDGFLPFLKEENMSLIEKISAAVLEDDEPTEKQSELLVETYLNSNDKQAIDNCFICLCGYSLSSLIN